ncbi:hypothetical protein XA68_13337 [Ophiocordyceps unilateralis]|uniref:Uncharacterized protein n=1 Tax=Ophiocordyceps unilateralis TaxID=268505 RepID=A0A2A9PCU7_OPHUN|nr:hypothetical protein XA68_13337 [Ophiocordyceps unilateralis]
MPYGLNFALLCVFVALIPNRLLRRRLRVAKWPWMMQPTTQQVHDDLASLFSRTLNFNNNNELKETIPRLDTSPSSPPQHASVSYSISQHYNHSAHTAAQQSPPTTTTTPPKEDWDTSSEAVALRTYGIDDSVLTPSQLQLFCVADEAQKLRLMELWSICPPARTDDIPVMAWSSSTLENEELLARLRFHDQQQQHRQHHLLHHVMSLDGTPVQTADGTWSPSAPADTTTSSEPYMLSGYEELMRRERERDAYSHLGYTPATDPIYRGPDFARHQQHLHMAMQYGAADHFRAAPEVDAMDVM